MMPTDPPWEPTVRVRQRALVLLIGELADCVRVARDGRSRGFAGRELDYERCAGPCLVVLPYAARGGFRHIIVLDGSEVVGSCRCKDIVRCWGP